MANLQLFPEDLSQWSRDNSDKIGIIIMRTVLAMVWFSQAMAKVIKRDNIMNNDHDEFLGQLKYMRDTHPYSFVENFIDNVLISNVDTIVYIVIFTELFVAGSLGLGLFTRAGAFVGGVMTIGLFTLTLGWDEWIWTYPLIFFPHVLFFLSRSGRQIGIDRTFVDSENKLINLIS